MTAVHVRSGEVVDLESGSGPGDEPGPVALVRDDRIEVMRWVLAAGRAIPEHLAFGPATILCVTGEVRLTVPGGVRRLLAGNLVYLAAGERHSLLADADSVLLVTMVLVDPPPEVRQLVPDPDRWPVHGRRTGQDGEGEPVH